MTVVLTAERTAAAPALTLRPWRIEDADALVRAHRDPEMRRRLTTKLTSLADARRWIREQGERWTGGDRFSFAVLEHGPDEEGMDGTGPAVGQAVVKPVAGTGLPTAEVGC